MNGESTLAPHALPTMIMLCSKTYATAENKKVLLKYYNNVGIGDMKSQFESEKKIIL